MGLFRHCRDCVQRNLLILAFKWVYGILNLLGPKSKANLVAELTLSFPFTSMWSGIQHLRILSELYMKSNQYRSLMIRSSSSFLLLSDSKTESESENMIKFWWLLSEIMLSARFIVWALAIKMEFSFERAFLTIVLWLCTLFYCFLWSHQIKM